MTRTAAFVGATGGAGATRLAVETGVALARDGRSVAVLDAALDTQGLCRHAEGRIDPDFTRVLTGDADLEAALVEYPEPTSPGRLALAPARAPFARLAAAKAPAAGERMSDLLAPEAFDCVLVDAPPVATNPAVGAVTAADAVAVVAPDTERGRDGVARERGRLADVDAPDPTVVYNRAATDEEGGDHRIPTAKRSEAGESAVAASENSFAPATAALAEDLLDTTLDDDYEGGLLSL